MKQHITKTQLNEISYENRRKLQKLFPISSSRCVLYSDYPKSDPRYHKPRYFIPTEFVYNNSAIMVDGKAMGISFFYPLLSIGQMIEFLNDKRNSYSFVIDVEDDGFRLSSHIFLYNGRNPELRDVLWEVVKGVLNEN